MTTLLFDGDMLLYKAAAGSESLVQWDHDWWILGGNLGEAKDLISAEIDSLTTRFQATKNYFCLSDQPTTFRHDIYPAYKAGRSRKPLVYAALRQWAIETLNVVIRNKLEADDCMGILATNGKTPNPVIVSDDKDMLTIPGVHWRLGELITTTPEEAWELFLTQAMTGDTTDGYNGCPGIGPVKAYNLLKKQGPIWETVVSAYVKKGFTEDDALLNARLARILHASDWDAKRQTVRLWQPPLPESNTDETKGE
jgi:DNA polymerase-1